KVEKESEVEQNEQNSEAEEKEKSGTEKEVEKKDRSGVKKDEKDEYKMLDWSPEC
ncbi:25324_t:CDS:2, partial [Dentiscutata erythropus]